jgi:GT2 family glycosyltransferase
MMKSHAMVPAADVKPSDQPGLPALLARQEADGEEREPAVSDLPAELERHAEEARLLNGEVAALDEFIVRLGALVQAERAQAALELEESRAFALGLVEEFQAAAAAKDAELLELGRQLRAVQSSRAWRVAEAVRSLRHRHFLIGGWRLRILRALARRLRLRAAPPPAGPRAGPAGEAPASADHPEASGGTMLELAFADERAASHTDPTYAAWIDRNEPSAVELDMQRRVRFAFAPIISIIVPTFNTPLAYLKAMLDSVRSQTYANWELCIADGGSADVRVRHIIRQYARHDPRIRARFLGKNLGIAGNSNAALDLATGDYVALLDHDDELAPFALFEIVKAVNLHPDADLLYSDEDKISADGRDRSDPHFKPAWSPDLLRSYNYICHLTTIRRDLLERLGGFRPGFDGSQDYDLVLRVTEAARAVVHIPKILYHWRTFEGSTAADGSAKMYAYESAKKALGEHLARCGAAGQVKDGPFLGTYQVIYRPDRQPLVSVIIPNRDQQDDLYRCLGSIDRAQYPNYEILIVENGSTDPRTHAYYREISARPNVRILAWDGLFNYAAVNNFAVRHARGELLLLLNNDLEAIHSDWLDRLVEHALRPEVGAVGAKLYYPDDTIQHGGVILGQGGVAGHAHWHLPRSHPGYFARLSVTHNLQAVTAACVMLRKEVFEEVGGLDERFILAFNDIDLCMRVREKGYLVVWTPYAELYHFESKTRGPDDTPEKRPRFFREARRFHAKWSGLLVAGDPYYSPHLSLEHADFRLRLQQRLSACAGIAEAAADSWELEARSVRIREGRSYVVSPEVSIDRRLVA